MQTQEREKDPTCKERVKESCKSRFNAIMTLYKADCEGIEYVEDLGTIHEYGLSFDYVAPGTYTGQRVGYFRYQISWGGPSEEFRIWTNPDLSPYKIQFWFLDWSDGASLTLTGKRFDQFADFFTSYFVASETARVVLEESTKDM